MKNKYATYNGHKQKGDPGGGRYVDPSTWITGPDPIRHDKYYAFLKHRAQANYRKEPYDLTWEDWEQLWTPERWECRGRKTTDLCLYRIDLDLPWSSDNCAVDLRIVYLRRAQEYRDAR